MWRVSIGSVVKAWREARGLTLTQLAARAGKPLTKGYLSQLEHDKIHRPGDEHLERLAHALAIPVEYLLTRRLPDNESLGPVAGERTQQLMSEERDREEELLRQMLTLVEELQTVLTELLAERRRQHNQ